MSNKGNWRKSFKQKNGQWSLGAASCTFAIKQQKNFDALRLHWNFEKGWKRQQHLQISPRSRGACTHLHSAFPSFVPWLVHQWNPEGLDEQSLRVGKGVTCLGRVLLVISHSSAKLAVKNCSRRARLQEKNNVTVNNNPSKRNGAF